MQSSECSFNMNQKHPIRVAQCAHIDKSLSQCDLNLLDSDSYVFQHKRRIFWVVKTCVEDSVFCHPVRLSAPLYSSNDVDNAFSSPPGGESWWRSTTPWPPVSSVYEECHHGWQLTRSMIYTLPIATGTCWEETTCLWRSGELFHTKVSLMP